ncbi:hypothetical protein GJ496_000658 [Pomphorhynchus laevis]|nr:hypothetical protein GJ496_000658 [Pomphorhynchus laevis]
MLSSLDPDTNKDTVSTLQELIQDGPTLYDLHWEDIYKKSRKGIGACENAFLRIHQSVNTQIVSEVAFQLDRRILTYIFYCNKEDICERQSLYGLSVNTIPEMILFWSHDLDTGIFDVDKFEQLKRRYGYLMRSLTKVGYDECYHPKFCIKLINTYGLSAKKFSSKELCRLHLDKWNHIRSQLQIAVPESQVEDILIVFDALLLMVQDDQKPIFRF